MATDRSVPGAFGKGEIKFVCDTKFANVRLPDSTALTVNDFASSILQSHRLPNLNNAPVSAWMLARLSALAGSRFPFSYGQIVGSDGDSYWIVALAFLSSGAIKPIGSMTLLGDRTNVKLFVDAVGPFTPEKVTEAFLEVLLESPNELRRALVTVVYTSVEDPNHAKHMPYTLGWDGSSFIFRESPEHAIHSEDV